jgi:hypothetical protein
MHASLAPERLDGFYLYLVRKRVTSITDQCPVNMNILAPKVGAPNIKLQFSKKLINNFDYISVIYPIHMH